MLGYADVDPVSVPDTMISLIPEVPPRPVRGQKQMASNAKRPGLETESPLRRGRAAETFMT